MTRPKPSGFAIFPSGFDLSPTGAVPDCRRRFMIGDPPAVDHRRR
jgi:hypothetical protein